MVLVREETSLDEAAIRKVNEQAFGQSEEADLVDRLRSNCTEILSLVAVDEDQIVGHILFSPVRIEGERAVEGMGLGPMAVLPEYQRKGIGSLLIETGIDILRSRGHPFVVVLGHPEYYPRFGFLRASDRGIRSLWEGVPDEAFMILILDWSAVGGVSGAARYRGEFDIA